MKDPALFQGEIITKLRKYIDKFKKKFFSRTTGPISIKLGTNHPGVKGILDYQNEVPLSFLRADVFEIVKIHRQSSSIKPLGQFQASLAKLGKKHSWVKGFEFVQFRRPDLFTFGDNYKIGKEHSRNLKNLLLLNY